MCLHRIWYNSSIGPLNSESLDSRSSSPCIRPFSLISSASTSCSVETLILRSDTLLPLERQPLDLPVSIGKAATCRLIVLSVFVSMLFIETKLFQYQVLRSLYLEPLSPPPLSVLDFFCFFQSSLLRWRPILVCIGSQRVVCLYWVSSYCSMRNWEFN